MGVYLHSLCGWSSLAKRMHVKRYLGRFGLCEELCAAPGPQGCAGQVESQDFRVHLAAMATPVVVVELVGSWGAGAPLPPSGLAQGG